MKKEKIASKQLALVEELNIRSLSLRRLAEVSVCDGLVPRELTRKIIHGYLKRGGGRPWQYQVIDLYSDWIVGQISRPAALVRLPDTYERKALKLLIAGDRLKGATVHQRLRHQSIDWGRYRVKYTPHLIVELDGVLYWVHFWMYSEKSLAGNVGQFMADVMLMQARKGSRRTQSVVVDVFNGVWYTGRPDTEATARQFDAAMIKLDTAWQDFLWEEIA